MTLTLWDDFDPARAASALGVRLDGMRVFAAGFRVDPPEIEMRGAELAEFPRRFPDPDEQPGLFRGASNLFDALAVCQAGYAARIGEAAGAD